MENLLDLATKHFKSGEFREAILNYEKLVNDDEWREKRADLYSNLALCHIRLGEYEESKHCANKCLKIKKELVIFDSQSFKRLISLCTSIITIK